MSAQTFERTVVVCDVCDTKFEDFGDKKTVRALAKASGWYVGAGKRTTDLCPKCLEEHNESCK